MFLGKDDAHRLTLHGIRMDGCRKFPGCTISFMNHDRAAVLVGDEEPPIRWVKRNMAGVLSAIDGILLQFQHAGLTVAVENRDGIVRNAVTDVDEFAISRNRDLTRKCRVWGKAGREGRDESFGLQRSDACVPGQDVDRGIQLIYAIEELCIRAEGGVAGTRAWSANPRGWFCRSQLGRSGIDAVGVDAVEAEIVHQEVASIWRRHDAVRERVHLALFIGPAAFVLEVRDRRRKRPIRSYVKGTCASATIVRHKDAVSIRRDGDVRGSVAFGIDLVQQLQSLRAGYRREGTDALDAAASAFVHGIDEVLCATFVERQKRRATDLCRQRDLTELTCGHVPVRGENSGSGTVSVRADQNARWLGRCGGFFRQGCFGDKGCDGERAKEGASGNHQKAFQSAEDARKMDDAPLSGHLPFRHPLYNIGEL